MRALSASERAIAWRIHQVAYVENFKPPAVVELLRRADEADRALLDQVQERQALVAVVLCDRDDESEVRLDHLLLGVEIAALDPLGEADFLLRRQQPSLPDVLHEQLKRIGGHFRLEIKRRPRVPPAAPVGRGLGLEARCGGWVDFLDQLDFIAFEQPVQLLHVGFLQTEAGRGGLDLAVREHSDL